MSHKLQREIKTLVDELLKKSETKSLKYTKVGVKEERGGFSIYIKIYLEAPIKMNTINDLVKSLSSKYNVPIDVFAIYSPHARAIRISFNIPTRK